MVSALSARHGAVVYVLARVAWAVRFVLSLVLSPRLLSALAPVGRFLVARVPLLEYALSSQRWGHSSCVKSIAVIGDHVYTGCWDYLVKKWDARTGACVLTFVGHRQDIIGVAAHGASLFSCGDFCRLWDTQTGDELARFGVGTYYCAIANATHVFAARANGAIEMFAYAHKDGAVTASGAVVIPERTLAGHLAGVMDFDLRGDMLLSASIDLTARAWSISTGEILQTFTGHNEALRCCCLWRDSLFTGSLDRTIRQWSLASGECVAVNDRHAGAVRALIAVGDSLFSASSDHSIAEWDLAGGAPTATHARLRSLDGHTDGVFALCEHDGRLYSGSADKTCKRWCLERAAVTQEYCSRRPEEMPAIVCELLLRAPLRELLPPLTHLKPLRTLSASLRDVAAAMAELDKPRARAD